MTDLSSNEEEEKKKLLANIAAELLETSQELEIERKKECGTYILHLGQVHIEIPSSYDMNGSEVMDYFEKTLKNLHKLYGNLILQGHHHSSSVDEEGSMFR